MTSLPASKARASLFRLIEESEIAHQPLLIIGKRNNAVLISEADWTAIQESLHLLTVPGMRNSIIEGVETPTSELADKLDW